MLTEPPCIVKRHDIRDAGLTDGLQEAGGQYLNRMDMNEIECFGTQLGSHELFYLGIEPPRPCLSWRMQANDSDTLSPS